MKAGLVTFYNTNQSGPLLRAAALERAAEALGVSCEIIAYQPDGQSVQSPRRKNTSGGSRTGPRISGHCFSSLEELQSAELPYDVILASGPVWDPRAFPGGKQDPVFFGAFSRRRKIPSAPSFSSSRPEETEELGRYLAAFSHLSAGGYRDKAVMEAHTGRTVPVVLDPLLLLTAQEWADTPGG